MGDGGSGDGVWVGSGVSVGAMVGTGVSVGSVVAVGSGVGDGVSEVQASAIDNRTVKERERPIKTGELGFKMLSA